MNTYRAEKPRAVLEAVVVLVLIVSLGPPGCQKGPEQTAGPSAGSAGLPRLLDLGAGMCIPCKMMAPILDGLKEEYAGSLEVVFIDVWKEKGAGEKYGIQTIPCQIFYDASGKELFRHEGFFSKEDILAKWKELGIHLQPKGSAQSGKT